MLNMHPMGAIFIISEYIRFGTTPLIIGRGGERRRMRPLLLAVRQRGDRAGNAGGELLFAGGRRSAAKNIWHR